MKCINVLSLFTQWMQTSTVVSFARMRYWTIIWQFRIDSRIHSISALKNGEHFNKTNENIKTEKFRIICSFQSLFFVLIDKQFVYYAKNGIKQRFISKYVYNFNGNCANSNNNNKRKCLSHLRFRCLFRIFSGNGKIGARENLVLEKILFCGCYCRHKRHSKHNRHNHMTTNDVNASVRALHPY